MVSAALDEVLGLPVRLLAEMPAASTLSVRVAGVGDVLLTASRARAQRAAQAGEVCLTPLEYESLAVALADGACTRARALEELRAKAHPLGHRITLARLLHPVVRPDGDGARWTFGQLLEALGAELVGVHVEGAAAAGEQAA